MPSEIPLPPERNEHEVVNNLEKLGSECIFAIVTPNGGEILAYGEDIDLQQILKYTAKILNNVQSGDTVKITDQSVTIHTHDIDKWRELGGDTSESDSDFSRRTLHLPKLSDLENEESWKPKLDDGQKRLHAYKEEKKAESPVSDEPTAMKAAWEKATN